MRYWQWVLSVGLAVGGVAGPALGQGHQPHSQGAIVVEQPYARSTVPGQVVGGGYLKISNQGKTDDKLVSVTADVAQSVELHWMSMDGDIARMRQIDAIDLPAGKTVELKPGGRHIMFMGLKAPLKTGSSVPVVLQFDKAGAMKLELKVQ